MVSDVPPSRLCYEIGHGLSSPASTATSDATPYRCCRQPYAPAQAGAPVHSQRIEVAL